MWQNVLVKAKSLLQFHHLVLVTQKSRDVCLYKMSHSFLAYGDRVEAGTGSCLMTRFLETDSILSSGRFPVFETKMSCKARLYFYLILSWIWRNNGDEWRRRERISQPRVGSSYLGHSSSITPRGRSCWCDRQSCFSVLRWGLYDFFFWSSFMFVYSRPDWFGLKINRLYSSWIFHE